MPQWQNTELEQRKSILVKTDNKTKKEKNKIKNKKNKTKK